MFFKNIYLRIKSLYQEETMLKSFSLAKKITGGFGIILILLIVLAFVGRLGFTQVVEKVDSSNEFQVLVNLILDARQNEQRFILTNDPGAVDIVIKDINILKTQAKNIVDTTGDQAIKKQAEQIIKTSDTFAKAFGDYVALAGKKDVLMEDMGQKASAALEITSGIRDEQKAKYDALMAESETKTSRMRQRVVYAERIKENFLQAKGYRMVMSDTLVNNVSTMTQWKGHHSNIKRDLKEVAPLMFEEISKTRHGKIILTQDDAIEKATLFFDNKTQENNQALIKAVKAMHMAIITFHQEMQELLEFYIEDVQIFASQMMELSLGADQVAKILLKTRILEKEFIRTEDEAVFQQIIQNISSIDTAISSIKENIDDGEKTKPLDGIQEVVNIYIQSFKSYAELMKSQQTAKTQMESNAAGIETICLESKDIMNSQMRAQIVKSTTFITIVSLCAVIFGILIAFVLGRIIIRPIKQVVSALKEISEGDADLTQRIEINTRDEIGELAKWFNAFIFRLNNIVVEIGSNSETVTASSGELLMVSEQMAQDSEGLASRSNSVAAAAEEMSSSMNSVAAASEQAATNLGTVADAAGQMQQTLNEVAQNCEKARNVSDNAARKVKTASERVVQLGTSARDINKVTEVITDIAAQTNLLALNATIEAARAGEAGKGFAVVASEIKGLAAQTAGATLDIKNRIKGIQDSTDDTVKDVEQITKVISQVTDIVSAIAAAIEEQSASATEVAENIDQASIGIGEVNENVAQSSQVSTEIAEDISKVNDVSEEMTVRSEQMKKNAQDLSELSGKLRDMIGVFKISVEDADNSSSKLDNTNGPGAKDISDLMPWGDKLKIGISQVDEQHKELVKMVNELHCAMKMKMGAKEAGQILARLAEYTVYHFKTEEDLFEEHLYPERTEHKIIHDSLVEKVIEFKTEFEEGRAALSMDLMQFLTDWLREHIMKTDKAYAPFLKEKGIN
jgi:hemerythrin-like metal-binding protein